MAFIEKEIVTEGVARVTLNRPEALNAFTFAMYGELLAMLEATRYEAGVQVIVLTGAGRAFCAGQDISGGGGSPDWVPSSLAPPEQSRAIMDMLSRIVTTCRAMPQPIIAAVNGAAAGVGYALALSSDICVTTKAAKWIPAFHNAGTGTEFGASWLLPRIVGLHRAMEILLTGRVMLGDEAASIGLCLRAYDDAAAMHLGALEIAARIMANVPRAVRLTKQSVWANLGVGSFAAALEMEQRSIALTSMSDDAQEKRLALAERRTPVFRDR